ncbi:MAG: zinc ribbon domain-containing protein, partial [Clostridia bacterium]|nr:zinc ribbon domain-containing protein [Clostridia bacterium]
MMICSHCGTQAENGARICPVCGGTLSPYSGKDGAMTIRQGRMRAMPPAYMPAAESGQYRQDAGRPGDRRKLETETIRAPQRRRSEGAKLQGMQRRGVNHALLIAIIAVVAVLMAIGLLVLAFRLPQG